TQVFSYLGICFLRINDELIENFQIYFVNFCHRMRFYFLELPLTICITSSSVQSCKSSAVYFSPFSFLGSEILLRLNLIKGPHLPFSNATFSLSHFRMYLLDSFSIFFSINSIISSCVRFSGSNFFGILTYRAPTLRNGPNRPEPRVTGSPLYVSTGLSAFFFSRINSYTLSSVTV